MLERLAGKFIVFDGNEGCGKSTVAHGVAARMEAEGLKVLIVRDPGTTRIGEQIRQILLNPDHTEMAMRCEMLLYMAARAQMNFQTIAPALADGQVVISDRFISSTLAYQLGGDGLTADEIRAVGKVAVGGRWPDLTIILDLPVEVSSQRVKPKFALFPDDEAVGEKDRIERRPTAYHEQVRKNYLEQAGGDPRYRIINADQPTDQVLNEAWHAIIQQVGES